LLSRARSHPVLAVAIATGRRYLGDGMIDRAPGLAYYGVLSMFPSLLICFALIRLVGGADAPEDLANYIDSRGSSTELAGALRDAAKTARNAPGTGAGAVGLAGLVTLIYGASRAFSATGRALDTIARSASVQRSVRRRAEDIGWTVVLLVAVLIGVVLATISGQVLEDLVGFLGFSGAAASVWAVLRWPAAALLALVVVGLVRWAAPTHERGRFRLLTPGIVATVALLALATVGFNVYVANIASYNATYGAFAGFVILLLWLWLGAISLLLGAELDAVLEERRSA
jgi:membrane protein